MDVSWVQVFILTLSECVAPAGKSVCQEQQFELEFLQRSECEYALQQLIAAKDELDYIIVNYDRSGCAPSAREVASFASLDDISKANQDDPQWRAPGETQPQPGAVSGAHTDRLSSLKSCEESKGVAPCKVGEIIVEEQNRDDVEVWREDN